MRYGVLLAACSVVGQAGAPQDRALVEVARSVPGQLQEPSFRADREYCGLIGEDAAGRLVATRARKGRMDSCTPHDFPDPNVVVIASFHTHGAWADDAGEVPSPGDVLGDKDEGIDGFVSTPGGRFWFIDGERGLARLVCNAGCLLQDPDYDASAVPPVRRV